MHGTSIGSRIRDIREKQGRSAREVSIAAGLSPNTVSELEKSDSRSPSVENLRKVAKTLGVSFLWLAEGRTDNHSTGFSESEAQPWIAPDPGGERQNLRLGRMQLIRTLAPDARTPSAFKITKTSGAMGLFQDDVLIIDSNAPEPPNGAIVVATVADFSNGTAITVVRRLIKPYLISYNPTEDEVPLVVDGTRTVIMGPVVASFRAPQITG